MRTLALPQGAGITELSPADGYVRCMLQLEDLRDLAAAVQRCRRLFDLDADPVAVGAVLGDDPALAGLVSRVPGKRVPGCVDGAELAIRAVLGQQVSVAGARTAAARLVARYGQPLPTPRGPLTHLFPDASVLADANLEDIPLPAARRRTLRALSAALAGGTLVLDAGADREEAERQLPALPGIGPWTAAYIAMRALGDADAFPSTDLGVRRAAERLGLPNEPAALVAYAERWRPWRAYATQYLWASLGSPRAGPGIECERNDARLDHPLEESHHDAT
jgi:AraC family transcriptional regulator of adaptative response / DNA-3-methyladenine glycosylase II